MAAVRQPCPTCDAPIVVCDNAVWLDLAEDYDEIRAQWSIMDLGGMHLASVGNPGIGNRGHHLHVHQPPEGVMD